MGISPFLSLIYHIEFSLFTDFFPFLIMQHCQLSGKMLACHAGGQGSIPRGNLLGFFIYLKSQQQTSVEESTDTYTLKSIQVNSRTNSNEVLHVQPQIDQNNYKKDLPHTGFEQAFSAWQSSTLSAGPQRLASKQILCFLFNHTIKIWGCA